MKKLILSLLVVSAFVAAPVSLFAQVASATDQAVGRATLITPITITNESDLNFGTLAASSEDGTAIVAAASSAGLTTTGGAQVIDDASASAASFTVTGEGNNTFAIDFPASITLEGTTSDLTVTLSGSSTGTLASGTTVIYIGGELEVDANSAGGSYVSDAFDVTVAYN